MGQSRQDPIPIALTCGEPAGVAPEITAKAWLALRGADVGAFFLIGDGDYFNSGPDIEIDLSDAGLTDCRIIVSANFELGGSAVAKFDADLNMLDSQSIEHGPFMTFAISVSEDLTLRRLIFLPLNDFEDNYFLFDPPANW